MGLIHTGMQEELLSRIFRRNWWVFAALTVASLPVASWRFTLGIVAGGLLVIAGFHVLHFLLWRTFRPENTLRDAKAVMIQYYARLFALGLVIFALMRLQLVDPFGLLLGLSVVVINLLGLAASESRGRTLFKEAG